MKWLEVYIVVLVFIGSIPANGTVIEYSRVQWWKSELGKVVMNKAISVALLFDLSLLVLVTRWLHADGLWLDIVRGLVFTYLVAAVTLQWRTLRNFRRRNAAAR